MPDSSALSGSVSPFVVAIDGPAASGKGTIGRAIARKYRFAYLDTGKLYRKSAAILLGKKGDPADSGQAAAAARLAASLEMPDDKLHHPDISRAASILARHPAVRVALVQTQRDFAARPPANMAGAVLDGRDIGSVICPNADLKIFVTARTGVRAARRLHELTARGVEATIEAVEAEIRERDRRDESRADAPLRATPDALLLDTSELSIEQAAARARAMVGACLARKRGE